MDAVQINDRVQHLQWPALPGLGLVHHSIGDRGNQAGRDLCAVHLLQVPLNLPNRHTPGVQGQDLVVKASPASLVLGHDLGLKAGMAVTWDADGQLAKVAFESLFAFAVAGIARGVGHAGVLGVTQVLGLLGLQGTLDQALG